MSGQLHFGKISLPYGFLQTVISNVRLLVCRGRDGVSTAGDVLSAAGLGRRDVWLCVSIHGGVLRKRFQDFTVG